jgi:hypothetical protein
MFKAGDKVVIVREGSLKGYVGRTGVVNEWNISRQQWDVEIDGPPLHGDSGCYASTETLRLIDDDSRTLSTWASIAGIWSPKQRVGA